MRTIVLLPLVLGAARGCALRSGVQVVLTNATAGFACSRWEKPTFFLSTKTRQTLPARCKELQREVCTASPLHYWTYRCSNASDVEDAVWTRFREGRPRSREPGCETRCPGSHEVLTLAQVAEQHPVKSAATQRAVDAIDELGVVVVLAGAPGSGKSTISALGALYGLRAMDLEDVPGNLGNDSLPVDHPLYNFSGHKEDLRLRGLAALVGRHATQTARKSSIVGLGAYKKLGIFKPYIDGAVSVMLAPSAAEQKDRFQARSELVGGDRQRSGHRWERLRDESDIVLHADGCPEHTLRDLCLAVLCWLHHAAADAVLHPALAARLRTLAPMDLDAEKVSRLYAELGTAALLGDRVEIRWRPALLQADMAMASRPARGPYLAALAACLALAAAAWSYGSRARRRGVLAVPAIMKM